MTEKTAIAQLLEILKEKRILDKTDVDWVLRTLYLEK